MLMLLLMLIISWSSAAAALMPLILSPVLVKKKKTQKTHQHQNHRSRHHYHHHHHNNNYFLPDDHHHDNCPYHQDTQLWTGINQSTAIQPMWPSPVTPSTASKAEGRPSSAILAQITLLEKIRRPPFFCIGVNYIYIYILVCLVSLCH